MQPSGGYAYLDDPSVAAPSVVTMNAIACAHARTTFCSI